jgi:hypothetical protein
MANVKKDIKRLNFVKYQRSGRLLSLTKYLIFTVDNQFREDN